MNLIDYTLASDIDKTEWLNAFQITTGLRYFGGKTFIGKYLVNHILNMAGKMMEDGKKADIFVDGFAGGGKIGFSIPEGFFDKIVINDINYGVYCFFYCCKKNPEALIDIITELGEAMSKDFFLFCAYHRNDRTKVEPLISAAMTYWVTQASFNGATDSDKAAYKLDFTDVRSGQPSRAAEKEAIEKIVIHAKKHIKLVHDKMMSLNIVIENLDYRDLIKKYNGKAYQTLSGKTEQFADNAMCNKLWYFDPPYHPATLCGGNVAPYEDSFSLEDARAMVDVLHGDYKKEYGSLDYFIKSDYNPKYTHLKLVEEYEDAKYKSRIESKKNKNSIKAKTYRAYVNRMKKQVKLSKDSYHDFDKLEDNIKHGDDEANLENPEFYVTCLGEFDKGAMDSENGTKLRGREYIWCRGNYIKDNR